MSIPTSRSAVTTSGWGRSAGWVPADSAWALSGSASALNSAAAIWERPALCTQAKIIVSGFAPITSDLHDHAVVGALLGHLVRVVQHFPAHVGEDNALGAEFFLVGDHIRVV